MSHTGRGFFMKEGRHELMLCFADPLSIRALTRINNEAQRMFLIPAIRSVGGARHTLSHRSLLDNPFPHLRYGTGGILGQQKVEGKLLLPVLVNVYDIVLACSWPGRRVPSDTPCW